MSEKKIRVRFLGSPYNNVCKMDFDGLTKNKIYNANFDGLLGFKNMVADDGAIWSGILNGYSGFRLLLESNNND